MPILINVVVFILTIIATCKEQANHVKTNGKGVAVEVIT
jgi:hypothetical protein